jgi:hypothetical protein
MASAYAASKPADATIAQSLLGKRLRFSLGSGVDYEASNSQQVLLTSTNHSPYPVD